MADRERDKQEEALEAILAKVLQTLVGKTIAPELIEDTKKKVTAIMTIAPQLIEPETEE